MKFTLWKKFDLSLILGVISLVLIISALIGAGCVAPAAVSSGGGEIALPQETQVEVSDNPIETPPQAVAPEESLPQAQSRDTLLVVTSSGLNIRSGRGASYAKLGTSENGDMLAYTEEAQSGWYKVLYKNGYGYVSASYVDKYSFDEADERIEKVIYEGKKLLGTPYVFGAQRYHYGNGVKNSAFTVSEFDCSSLMQYIFKIGANVNLDMTSRAQSLQGKEVAKSDIRRGDLLFFTNDSRKDKTGIERIGHVALYLGDNYILHTASDFAVIEQITAKRHSYYITARRVL